MDVILDVLGGNSFSIEVGPFDTVLHVKEKVQKIHHIPVSYQTFVFHGEILPDDLQLSRSQLRRGYRINLLVTAPDFQNLAPPPPPLPLGTPEFPPSSHLNPLADYCDQLFGSSTQVMPMPSNRNVFQELMPPPMRMTLKVKVPTILDRIPIEMECEDTVRKLKEKILALDNLRGIPVERIALQSHSARVELLNHQVLQDCCSVPENNEIDVVVKPQKLAVTVMPMLTGMKILIKVNPADNVAALRQELNECRKAFRFRLPENGGYFFVHKQKVLREEESFQFHGIRQGDTIETIDGFITDAVAQNPPAPTPTFGTPEFPPSLNLKTLPQDHQDPSGFGKLQFPSPTQVTPMQQMPPPQLPSLGPPRVTVNVKLPKSKDRIPIEMAENDVVGKLKKKIVALKDMQGVAVDRIVLYPGLTRGGMWNPNIDVFLKWSVPVTRGSSSVSRKQMVVLMPLHSNLANVVVEVNPMDNVSSVLKNQMKKLEEKLMFRLAQYGTYFFLYKEEVMNQQETFEWHGVRDGDSIRVFVGYVTDSIPLLHVAENRKYRYFVLHS
ncbi:hypothetical protein AAZX31_10G239500 [Glycine max]